MLTSGATPTSPVAAVYLPCSILDSCSTYYPACLFNQGQISLTTHPSPRDFRSEGLRVEWASAGTLDSAYDITGEKSWKSWRRSNWNTMPGEPLAR
eukprot:855844-Prorocentrum_minimum.AAC.1